MKERILNTSSPTSDPRPNNASEPMPLEPISHPPVPLGLLLDGWVSAGEITAEQAARLRDPHLLVEVPGRPEPARQGPSLAVEALGYLGGVIMAVASISLAALYWEDLSEAARMLLVGGAAAVLLTGGWLVTPRLGEAAVRIRSVLWVATTLTVAGFLGLVTGDVLAWGDEEAAVTTAAGTTLAAGLLWSRSRVFFQQAVFFIAAMVTAALTVVLATDLESWPGAAAWVVAVVWFALGWKHALGSPVLAQGAASAGAIVAAMTTFPADAGIVLALVTAISVVGLGVWCRDLVMVGIGSLGLLQLLPMVVSEWFPDTVAAPFVLLGVGVLVLGTAVWTAVRGRPETPTHRRKRAA